MRFALLRGFVLLALAANLVYAAWSHGWFGFAGFAPATQRDPQRSEQQLRPGGLRVLTPAAAAAVQAEAAPAAPAAVTVGPPAPSGAAGLPAAAAEAAAAEAASAPAAAAAGPFAAPAAPAAPAPAASAAQPLACLDIGPFDTTANVESVERTLAALLPSRPWVRESRPGGPQYAVFVGPVLSRDAARQRREELVKLKFSFEAIELNDARYGGKVGGYSLGLHDSEADAQLALSEARERGLRNATVALARPAGGSRIWLRIDRLDTARAAELRALPASQIGGRTASACVLGTVMSVRGR
jgi:hypothetical protein